MKQRWWLLALGVHLAFFGAWTGLEEWRHRSSQVFLLETEGADPRDLWSGDYLALAFPAARLDGLAGAQDGQPVALRLDAAGSTVVAGQTWPLRRAGDRKAVPGGDFSAYPAEAGWARGEIQRGRAVLGIERFYFSEAREQDYRRLVPGRYFALVSMSPDGRLRLQRLIW